MTFIHRSENFGLPAPHRTTTTKSLSLAAVASLLAGNAALAQSTLPTKAQLSAWDKKFLPGQYRPV